MSTRAIAMLVLVASSLLAACGSSGGAGTGAQSADVGGTVVAVGGAPVPGDDVGSIGDAVEVAAGAPADAGAAACEVDRQTLELATETYELLNGAVATSQQDLLDAQMILEPSPRFVIDADGAVTPAPDSPCA
jgi:predicted small secreted protein